ncbi:MAG: DUF11 domain-containing protein [Lachnospiraceae bacterium]|nr:DUF11 domain-containing protein [Lachnospiraceae bacterium]
MQNVKILLYIITVIITVGGALLLPFPTLAWEDNNDDGRPSYTIDEINNGAIGATLISDGENYKNSRNYPGQIIFNTISNSTIGDEKNFVGAREFAGINVGTDTFWHGNDITVKDGKTYIIRLFVHNNNPNSIDAVAEDVRVTFSVPQTPSDKIEVKGYFRSSNATPSEYWDGVNFISDVPFHLEYIAGSAQLKNNGIGINGIQLSDDIINVNRDGVLIGYDALDGRIPGGYQYDNYVTIEVKVVYESFSRSTYSLQQINEDALGDTITFNSIKISDTDATWYKKTFKNDLPIGTLHNETNFVGARVYTGTEADKNTLWSGTSITAEDGQEYTVRLYVHNNNPKGEKAVAENTQVRFYVPYVSSDSVKVNGWLKADNADAGSYDDHTFLDEVTFKSKDGSKFHLEYVYASALLENDGFAHGGVAMPDTVVNQGNPSNEEEDEWTLIGYNDFDGQIPGCYEYISYVTIRVKVIYDYDFTIETKVRLADDKDKTWKKSVEAKVGDKVEFQLTYTNTGDVRQNNAKVRNNLPSNLHYVENSTKLKNALYPNILNITDGVPSDILKGINIGNYEAGANAHVMFTAEIVDDDLIYGKNTMVNWGQAGIKDKTIQDRVEVIVYKKAPFNIIPTILPIGIVACLTGIVLLLRKTRLPKHPSVL